MQHQDEVDNDNYNFLEHLQDHNQYHMDEQEPEMT